MSRDDGATYIKQLFYIHLFIDFFSKDILVLPNKHNVGVCQVHSGFLLHGKNMGNKKVSVLISKALFNSYLGNNFSGC